MIEEDLRDIGQWLDLNGIRMNVAKTEVAGGLGVQVKTRDLELWDGKGSPPRQ